MPHWKKARLLCISILASTFAAGNASSAPQQGAPAKAVRLAAGTGSAGSTYFILGNAIATLVNKHVEGVTLIPEAAPSSSETVVLIHKGERQLGLAPPDTVYRAKRGEGEFKGVYDNVRVLFSGFVVALASVVRADSPIESFNDVKGKKMVSISTAVEPLLRGVLRAYGIKDDEYRHQYLSQSAQVTALRERTIDVAQLSAWPRSATLLDLSGGTDVRFLTIEPEPLKRFRTGNPFYIGFPVPANTYKGQSTEVITPALGSLYLASPTVSDDVAYRIVKAVMENRQELIDTYAASAAVSLDGVRSYIQEGLITAPFHPGALRYYKEKGLSIPGQ
jgi:TRAP transporter TAXI family solute receptor